VVASLVAHGVAIGAAARWLGAARDGSVVAAIASVPRAAELAPITVMLFDAPGVAPPRAVFAIAAGARHAAAASGVSSEHVAGPAHDGAPRDGPSRDSASRDSASGEGASPRGLGMRGPDLTIDQPFVDRLFRDRQGISPAAVPGRVKLTGGGTGVIEDRVTAVRVDRDGTAHFADRPDFDAHWNVHLPTTRSLQDDARELGRAVTAWYADPSAQARAGRVQDLPRHLLGKPGECDHWDDPCSQAVRSAEADRQDDLDNLSQGYQVGGKSELTDALMRRFVGDPYAARKQKLLDDSRAFRAALGARYRAEDRARSAEKMQRNVEALWRATDDAAARRDALFALWDECEEGDGADGEAGQRARTIVIGWIRARLPPGSVGAFTAEQVAAYGARRGSRQAFVPYE
jgi:hypothetical protein